ncbi:mannose-1-phosphate guanylyltransferase/mannose-6-phosphate isomerase [Sphingomonas nostoxanthinifaciens]|uniref:mannose-1-phosphate guanylyltransferase/mannose-6-phosphate isomerase n=1 Tax=Sphingomonas nostoxanthinifaciens TaxID=2872652 RepID=UPI001CC1EADD|nr:mannose-1-phosphate guanylyltransferase/mannose-6-phosphate isomerase [Sphingomonas nostoxanthinifaciens]UAK25427.1 mannose-1-phosphate guanylyltransferase/mannose-6-phosphate isomerase [Sphingomonas nostoxanthinifaciens]
MSPIVTPVILSGGSGTRLWPLSRTGRPKQLLSLTSADTMLQLTAKRTGGAGFAQPLVVANAAHADMIERQLQQAGISDMRLILEPVGRNTAPAIAAAALALDRDALMLVMPSDHVIDDVEAFRQAVAIAVPLVADGWLATLGITPDQPETGYGYIKRGAELAPGVARIDRFVEKPDRDTASAYLAEGGYSWNGGIFLFGAGAYLDALERYAPEILSAVRTSMENARHEGSRIFPDPHAFAASPSQAVDYAVMEKTDKAAVVPVEMGWSDVGSWDALHAISVRDEGDNAHHGEVVAIDTKGCLIRSEGPLVAAVGVKDLIVIATPDAVLILPRGSSQDVKRAIQALEKDGHVTLHRAMESATAPIGG